MPSADPPVRVADLTGRHVAIVGVGREGLAMAAMLTRDVPTATVVGIDQHDGDAADNWRNQTGLPLIVSDTGDDLPTNVEVAVVSPGIPPHNPLIRALDAHPAILTSGTDLFFAENSDRIIAVTGSKGKSTTSALIHHLLVAHGVDAVLGGNVGVPLWDLDDADWVVAEVSSYQASRLHHSPHTAVLTALFEEHIDWHGSFEAYATDKLNLVGHGPRHVVVNTTNALLSSELGARHPNLPRVNVGPGMDWDLLEHGERVWLGYRGELIMAADQLPVPGIHNAWNVLLALAAVETITPIDTAIAARALQSFQPLPHRMQPIDDPSGVVFLNDSLATNPVALAAALRSLRHTRVLALIGGHDRGVDDSALAEEIIAHPPAVLIGLPDSGPVMLDKVRAWLQHAGIAESSWPEMVAVADMDAAVVAARQRALPGDVVTLSPGAPSFGRYRDYQHRAEDFLRAIAETAP